MKGATYYNQSRMSKEERWLRLTARPTATRGASKYRGVSVGNRINNEVHWKAVFVFDGRRHYAGTFKTEEEAALAWNKLALEIIGPLAEQRLNQVPQQTEDKTSND